MDFRSIIIMRHAKSDWNTQSLSDFDRPLNKRGTKDAPRMAQWMANQKLKPDLLICSPAQRARQTATEVIKHSKLDDASVVFDKRMYLASVNTLLSIIREVDDRYRTIMLIGHNPGLENLAIQLTHDELPLQANGSLMTTANIFQFRVAVPWSDLEPKQAEFIQLMRPKELA